MIPKSAKSTFVPISVVLDNPKSYAGESIMREALSTLIYAAKKRIAEIDEDDRYKQKTANVQVNAPLALVQLQLTVERDVLIQTLVAIGEREGR